MNKQKKQGIITGVDLSPETPSWDKPKMFRKSVDFIRLDVTNLTLVMKASMQYSLISV